MQIKSDAQHRRPGKKKSRDPVTPSCRKKMGPPCGGREAEGRMPLRATRTAKERVSLRCPTTLIKTLIGCGRGSAATERPAALAPILGRSRRKPLHRRGARPEIGERLGCCLA